MAGLCCHPEDIFVITSHLEAIDQPVDTWVVMTKMSSGWQLDWLISQGVVHEMTGMRGRKAGIAKPARNAVVEGTDGNGIHVIPVPSRRRARAETPATPATAAAIEIATPATAAAADQEDESPPDWIESTALDEETMRQLGLF